MAQSLSGAVGTGFDSALKSSQLVEEIAGWLKVCLEQWVQGSILTKRSSQLVEEIAGWLKVCQEQWVRGSLRL
jgi:hypothetical protein